MTWKLSDDWIVSRDAYNWILLRNTGHSWKRSYHASPDQLLNTLLQVVLRTHPAEPDLRDHLENCLNVAEDLSRRFQAQLQVCPKCAEKLGRKKPTERANRSRSR